MKKSSPKPSRKTDRAKAPDRPSGLFSAALQGVLPLFEPSPPPAPRMRETRIGTASIRYHFRRSARRSIGFTIDARGLTVAAPRWVSLADVDRAVAEKHAWIERKSAEWRAFEERRASLEPHWDDGGEIRYLGKSVRITRCPRASAVHLDTRSSPWALRVPQSMRVRHAVEAWLKARAHAVFEERMASFEPRVRVRATAWTLSHARTQWGSCNSRGMIRLNWRLVHLPLELVDYVVAHELAHLVELNHGPAFWREVERLLPGHAGAREALQAMPEHLAA